MPDILRVLARIRTWFTIRGELLGYFREVRSSNKSDDNLLSKLFQEIKHFFGDFLWPRQTPFDYEHTNERTCLAGVRVPSTSNRTSFLMGRSAKEAIATERVKTWDNGQVGGERGSTSTTWPHPPRSLMQSGYSNNHPQRSFPPLYTSVGDTAADRLAFFHTLERLKVRYGLSHIKQVI